MGNKTIYVKNEELWEAAKLIAGKAGLSAFIEEALDRLVTVKRLEQKDLEPFSLPVEPIDESLRIAGPKERLGFHGKCLVNWGPIAVYLTKGGTFIVTDNNGDGSIYEYRTHDKLADLRRDRSITALDSGEQDILWERVLEALPPTVFTTWID